MTPQNQRRFYGGSFRDREDLIAVSIDAKHRLSNAALALFQRRKWH